MKRFFCFIIALFILFSIAFPCFAELREDGNGETAKAEKNNNAPFIILSAAAGLAVGIAATLVAVKCKKK